MRVGFDIDGVLAEFSEHFLDYLGIEDKTPPDKWNDERFTKNFHKIMYDENFWLTMPRLVDPKDLHLNPVIYVTARAIPVEVTKKWLDKNGFYPAPVISVGHNGSKVEHLKGRVDYFIDDAYHNYVELNKAGIKCVLITRSHNIHEKVERRIDNINQILNYE